MVDVLTSRVCRLKDDFFTAIAQGPDAIAAFNDVYLDLRCDLEEAVDAGTLPAAVRDAARASVTCIEEQAQLLRSLDTLLDDVVQSEVDGNLPADAGCPPSSPIASLPLFQYLVENICYPYPDAEEKERIAAAVRELGWRDFDKRKLEDWLNRKRNQSGFVAILRNHCGDDREAMRRLCEVALCGSPDEKASLPEGSVEDVEDMLDLVQSQLEELTTTKDTTWVDDLTSRVEAVLYSQVHVEDSASDVLSSDESYSDSSDDDSDSDCSSTDVDDDNDEPPRCIIGSKRKFTENLEASPPLPSRFLSRTFSVASSTSSSSTACSMRLFSGASLSSMSSVECDDDDIEKSMCDRPAKRSRSESYNLQPGLVVAAGVPELASTFLSAPQFTSYQTKRKRTDDGLATRMRSMKRSRYAALGVAQTNAISDTHLASLSRICNARWTPPEIAPSAFNVDAYTIDCTQPNYEGEDVGIAAFYEDDQPAEDIITWCKLQVYTIFRMLLPVSIRPLPPALAESTTLSFDVNALAEHDVTSLRQLFALTPKDITAMFESVTILPPVEDTSICTAAEPDNTLQDSPSPTSSSSSSSESLSPPALSEDSGSSTRSSSVEPRCEQDSLFMSPAALSADYSLYNDLFSGKTLSVDSSQVNVELGATPDNIAENELSGAADLLARYLQDYDCCVKLS